MANTTPPLSSEQVNTLLDKDDASLSQGDLIQILRYLVKGQIDLEGRARQLKSAVGRLGR